MLNDGESLAILAGFSPEDAARLSKELENLINMTITNSDAMEFVRFVANDYIELSHDKIVWQRNDFIKRAQKILV
jgi:hypothetical protein